MSELISFDKDESHHHVHHGGVKLKADVGREMNYKESSLLPNQT